MSETFKCLEPISIEKANIILNQLKKCICQIFEYQNYSVNGFFCKIPYHNKILPVLISCYHILEEPKLIKNEEIIIDYCNWKKKIKINDNRLIYANKNLDITIIEINPEIDCIYDFLEIDINIFYDENNIKKHSIYILQNNYHMV